ncbi:MAG: ABC transporter ATP-binding protein [candidate division Zixibacteria bacterium]|nr:ABC transporter ATP-binding protein [candidate division Zixibacteria bacterium]
MYRIKATNLFKRFRNLKVLKDINFDLTTGDSMAIVGRNGSGKSTLLQVLLSIYTPTKGKVEYFSDEKIMDDSQIRSQIALVSPYLNLYDQLTAEENLKFFSTVSGFNITGKEIDVLLKRVGLGGRGLDYVGGYSSGMKQRLKYAAALLKNPGFLFLDEPTSNLDDQGKEIVFNIIEEFKPLSIVIIATNEKEEYRLVEKQLRVD